MIKIIKSYETTDKNSCDLEMFGNLLDAPILNSS